MQVIGGSSINPHQPYVWTYIAQGRKVLTTDLLLALLCCFLSCDSVILLPILHSA